MHALLIPKSSGERPNRMFAREVEWGEIETWTLVGVEENESVDTVECEDLGYRSNQVGDTRRVIKRTGVIPLVRFAFVAKCKLQSLLR